MNQQKNTTFFDILYCRRGKNAVTGEAIRLTEEISVLYLLSLRSVLYEAKREGNELGEIGYSFRGEIKTHVQVANLNP